MKTNFKELTPFIKSISNEVNHAMISSNELDAALLIFKCESLRIKAHNTLFLISWIYKLQYSYWLYQLRILLAAISSFKSKKVAQSESKLKEMLKDAGEKLINEVRESTNVDGGIYVESEKVPIAYKHPEIPDWLSLEALIKIEKVFNSGKKLAAIRELSEIAKTKGNMEASIKWSKEYLENACRK